MEEALIIECVTPQRIREKLSICRVMFQSTGRRVEAHALEAG